MSNAMKRRWWQRGDWCVEFDPRDWVIGFGWRYISDIGYRHVQIGPLFLSWWPGFGDPAAENTHE